MNEHPLTDVAIVGGGLAGLSVATILARAGRSVVLFEKAPHSGGRATTQNVDGFSFNQGPHALYRGGHAIAILRELGIQYRGAQASYDGSWALANGARHPLPGTPESWMTTPLLTDESRLEAVKIFGGLPTFEASEWNGTTLSEWLGTFVQHEDVRELLRGYLRLATYGNAPEIQSAGAAIEQLKMAREGVDYLDGGWQSLVDALRDAAVSAGVRIETRTPVAAIDCEAEIAEIHLANQSIHRARSVVTTVGPDAVARMIGDGRGSAVRAWANAAVPIHAACLDIALSQLPNPEHQFAIGLDRPHYYSVHTRSAKLAPGGGIVIHVAKYLPSVADNPVGETQAELEGVMDFLQPGWRDVLAAKRYLPRMLVTNAVVTAAQGGTVGRPGPAVPGVPNLFVAGDWVGPEGMLVDASMASARSAAQLAQRYLDDTAFTPVANALATV